MPAESGGGVTRDRRSIARPRGGAATFANFATPASVRGEARLTAYLVGPPRRTCWGIKAAAEAAVQGRTQTKLPMKGARLGSGVLSRGSMPAHGVVRVALAIRGETESFVQRFRGTWILNAWRPAALPRSAARATRRCSTARPTALPWYSGSTAIWRMWIRCSRSSHWSMATICPSSSATCVWSGTTCSSQSRRCHASPHPRFVRCTT